MDLLFWFQNICEPFGLKSISHFSTVFSFFCLLLYECLDGDVHESDSSFVGSNLTNTLLYTVYYMPFLVMYHTHIKMGMKTAV